VNALWSLPIFAGLLLAACAGGCAASYRAAPPRTAMLEGADQTTAFRALASPAGPSRFAQVTPRLYRGAQPTTSQLEWLRTLGVRTVVSLDDHPEAMRAEAAAAATLGIKLVAMPFSGYRVPDESFLRRVVHALGDSDGAVYVHCRAGRDRTSLAVALYRVWVEGWSPDVAWRREAIEFGHTGVPAFFLRRLDRTYQRLTSPTLLAASGS
jgi:protein tyrosine phosphatase (PTP) superfamily phosphohydrolase (DUF442 family)